MKNGFFTLFVFAATFASAQAFAGECKMTITREACPGKDAQAYEPYKGQKTTEESKKVGSADACKKEADKACAIVRKGLLKSKSIKARFDGKDVEGGSELCDQKRADYNQCG